MPAARTIRRKMMGGLALVLVMLVILALSGISGLSSYRRAVHDLGFSINKAPRTADLSAAIGLLFKPLLYPPPQTDAGARDLQATIERQLADTRGELAEFQRKLDNLPPTQVFRERQFFTGSFLRHIEARLDTIETLAPALAGSERRADVLAQMRDAVTHALTVSLEIPDYQDGINRTLDRARDEYRSRFWLVCGSSAVVMFLFLGLVRSGYLGIFDPLRKLHQGACRVAQGDFDYRLELPSNDEMGELADSFNQMTARFQEIAGDLDRQVRERSKQLVRSERLAGIGFLAAGVAHEINNPLSAISMAADSLQDRMAELLVDAPPDEAAVVRQYLSMMQSEAERCQQITQRLLHFARGQEAPRVRTDVAAVVGEVLSLVRHMGRFRGRTVRFDHPHPCWLEVNGPEVKQVVLNIVANALESMEPGGTLDVRIVEQTDAIVLEFQDDGCGMTPETIDNLFEPFFTRRKDGKGTGLGMAISHRIVADHGGAIEAASDGPGHGSTFRVRLPRRVTAMAAA
ncbi:MAG TPA: ATP-binding protein [Planctomycetaceae bacterium]|nr:ATP-binding protein [Planctomycetaceae bacterium]